MFRLPHPAARSCSSWLVEGVAVLGTKHVTRKNGDYAALTSIVRPPKGVLERQSLINPVVVFSFANFDPETYRQLPNGLQEFIARSPDYREAGKGAATAPVP